MSVTSTYKAPAVLWYSALRSDYLWCSVLNYRMGNTYLCIACREGYLELCDYLISEGVSLATAHLPPFTPMSVVVKRFVLWQCS